VHASSAAATIFRSIPSPARQGRIRPPRALPFESVRRSKFPHLTTRRGGKIPKTGCQHDRLFRAAFVLFIQTSRRFGSEFEFHGSELAWQIIRWTRGVEKLIHGLVASLSVAEINR